MSIRESIAQLIRLGYAFTVWDGTEGDAQIDLKNSTSIEEIMECLDACESNYMRMKRRSFAPPPAADWKTVADLWIYADLEEGENPADFYAKDDVVERHITQAFQPGATL